MKILFWGNLDTGGMMQMYSNAINKYTNHEMRVVTFNETRGFDTDIAFNRSLWGAFNMRPPEYFHQEFMKLLEWSDIVIVNLGVPVGAGNPETRVDDTDFTINEKPFPGLLREMNKKVVVFLPGSTCLRRNYPFYIKICKQRKWPTFTPQPDIYRNVSQKIQCNYIPILVNDWHPRYRNSLFDFIKREEFQYETIHVTHSPTDKRIKNTDELISAVSQVNQELGENKIRLSIIENCGFYDSLMFKKQSFICFDQMQTDGYYCLSSVENTVLGLINMVNLDDYAIKLITDDMGVFPPSWEIVSSEEEIKNSLIKLYNDKQLLYDRMLSGYNFARSEWSDEKNIGKMVRILENV